ncbi:hypothetical protein BF17_17995 [Yersinia similis]|uniref:Ead/Ea22-like family protein n=1 Tax=Yersinia similis TaxID=367190 RepID=A0ABM5Q3Q1_9GAMM|nr:hypothetical protein [Yersinia similis]AHK22005.1 hypothetical protein BF17_17995 [Yersinia similis]CFQ48950.1 Uncharacterised protein [Yersinia similis]
MNNIEERIKFLKASVALSDLVGPDELTVTVSDLSALIAQLEAAQRDRDLHYRVSEKLRIELIAAEAELSAANEKLSKPAVLAEGSGWASDPYNNGRNAGIRECKFALKADGFAVEGE